MMTAIVRPYNELLLRPWHRGTSTLAQFAAVQRAYRLQLSQEAIPIERPDPPANSVRHRMAVCL